MSAGPILMGTPLPQSVVPLRLSAEELYELTGYKQARCQKRFFDALGVPSVIRRDNTLAVVREHLLRPPARLPENTQAAAAVESTPHVIPPRRKR